jgi:hypothetical protein
LTTDARLAGESRFAILADWQPLTCEIVLIGQANGAVVTGNNPPLTALVALQAADEVHLHINDPELVCGSRLAADTVAARLTTPAAVLSASILLVGVNASFRLTAPSAAVTASIRLAAAGTIWTTTSDALMTGIRLVGSADVGLFPAAGGSLHTPLAGTKSPWDAKNIRATATLAIGSKHYSSIKLAA